MQFGFAELAFHAQQVRSNRGALPVFPPGGFPRPASRTRRASRPGTGLSTSPDLCVVWFLIALVARVRG